MPVFIKMASVKGMESGFSMRQNRNHKEATRVSGENKTSRVLVTIGDLKIFFIEAWLKC
jgi:hypothetical protein